MFRKVPPQSKTKKHNRLRGGAKTLLQKSTESNSPYIGWGTKAKKGSSERFFCWGGGGGGAAKRGPGRERKGGAVQKIRKAREKGTREQRGKKKRERGEKGKGGKKKAKEKGGWQKESVGHGG